MHALSLMAKRTWLKRRGYERRRRRVRGRKNERETLSLSNNREIKRPQTDNFPCVSVTRRQIMRCLENSNIFSSMKSISRYLKFLFYLLFLRSLRRGFAATPLLLSLLLADSKVCILGRSRRRIYERVSK